jgi:hypothetical protein
VIFFAIGAGMIAATSLGKRKVAALRKSGTRIQTDFQGVERNRALDVNGEHPFQIITQWVNPESSKVQIFRSSNIWFDPTAFVTNKKIEVIIERGNPKKYLVDISFLPERE